MKSSALLIVMTTGPYEIVSLRERLSKVSQVTILATGLLKVSSLRSLRYTFPTAHDTIARLSPTLSVCYRLTGRNPTP